MFPSNPHPKWWQLYLLFPLLVGLFMLDFRLKLSTRGHQVVQFGILLLIYGLVHLWLKANSAALLEMDMGRYRGRVMVYRIPNSQLPVARDPIRSLFQLPDSEIKGMLSDTFELDYIDAEAIPVDEIPKKSKKE